jgi:hypothetical protein
MDLGKVQADRLLSELFDVLFLLQIMLSLHSFDPGMSEDHDERDSLTGILLQ